jgi:hypothetical protein
MARIFVSVAEVIHIMVCCTLGPSFEGLG